MSTQSTDETHTGGPLPGVSLLEVAAVLGLLVAFQAAFAATGFPVAVFETVHRALFIVVAGFAATWTLRRSDAFAVRTVAMTVAFVVAGLAALILFDPSQPTFVVLPALAVALAVGAWALSALVGWDSPLEWWTETYTTLFLTILGTAVLFAAAGPTTTGEAASGAIDVSTAVSLSVLTEGLGTRLAVTSEGTTSGVYAVPALVGAGVYLAGRAVGRLDG